MVRTAGLLLVAAFLGLPVASTLAQAPGTGSGDPRPAASTAAAQPEVLPGFPQIPDEPRSLYLPGPAAPPPGPPLPGPYFEPSPVLDPPPLPQPGWYGDAEMILTSPYVKSKLNSPIFPMQLPTPRLDWTASPRFEVGYRLPTGFGGFAFSYRFLDSDATAEFIGPDGPETVTGRLDLEVFDLAYSSDEFSLWPNWQMKWSVGGRVVNVYFDSRAAEPVAEALAGSGIVASRSTDRFIGAGAIGGLQLERSLGPCGLGVVGRLEGFIGLGRQRQGFYDETVPGSLVAQDHVRSSQAVPALAAQLGLIWHPTEWPLFSAFVGYQYEKWWNVGRLNLIGSAGELEDQGVVLQARFNF